MRLPLLGNTGSLDPKRQEAAAKRAAEARRDADYHTRQAAAHIAKAEQIERTWGLIAGKCALDSGDKSE